jgi:hypothetical protein
MRRAHEPGCNSQEIYRQRVVGPPLRGRRRWRCGEKAARLLRCEKTRGCDAPSVPAAAPVCGMDNHTREIGMDRKFFIAWIVVFVAWMAGSFVVHGALLASEYAQLKQLFRPQEEAGRYFPLMILAHLIMAGAFVWIYQRGREDKPWLAQGLRYGIAIALLTIVPTYMIYYVVQPMPSAVVVKQVLFDGALMLILGVLTAWLFRTKAP